MPGTGGTASGGIGGMAGPGTGGLGGSGGGRPGTGGLPGSGGIIGTGGFGGGGAGGFAGGIVSNGTFSAGMSPWMTHVFATGNFSGYPKFAIPGEPACLPNRLANPYFQIDVPGGANGALEQQVTLPTRSTILSFVAWGGADPVTVTVSLVDPADPMQEQVLETFTPPPLQASNGSCTSSQILMKADPIAPTGAARLMTLRFRASASGSNGTIVGIDDVSID
jgi:hypothetical protein